MACDPLRDRLPGKPPQLVGLMLGSFSLYTISSIVCYCHNTTQYSVVYCIILDCTIHLRFVEKVEAELCGDRNLLRLKDPGSSPEPLSSWPKRSEAPKNLGFRDV